MNNNKKNENQIALLNAIGEVIAEKDTKIELLEFDNRTLRRKLEKAEQELAAANEARAIAIAKLDGVLCEKTIETRNV